MDVIFFSSTESRLPYSIWDVIGPQVSSLSLETPCHQSLPKNLLLRSSLTRKLPTYPKLLYLPSLPTRDFHETDSESGGKSDVTRQGKVVKEKEETDIEEGR